MTPEFKFTVLLKCPHMPIEYPYHLAHVQAYDIAVAIVRAQLQAIAQVGAWRGYKPVDFAPVLVIEGHHVNLNPVK